MEVTLAPRRRRRGPARAAAAGDPRVLRLRGLPYAATEADVTAFFEGFEVAVRGRRRGSRGGEEEEEEELEEEEEATEAEEEEVEEELEAASSASASAAAPIPKDNDDDKEEGEKGEEQKETPPANAATEEAAAALPPARAPPLRSSPSSSFRNNFDSGVEIVMRSDGLGGITGSGTGYVRFVSPEAADRARAARHRQLLGNR